MTGHESIVIELPQLVTALFWVLNGVLILLVGIIGWVVRSLIHDFRTLEKDFAKHKEDLPKEYVPERLYERDIGEIKQGVDKIWDYINSTQSGGRS